MSTIRREHKTQQDTMKPSAPRGSWPDRPAGDDQHAAPPSTPPEADHDYQKGLDYNAARNRARGANGGESEYLPGGEPGQPKPRQP